MNKHYVNICYKKSGSISVKNAIVVVTINKSCSLSDIIDQAKQKLENHLCEQIEVIGHFYFGKNIPIIE